MKKTINKKTKKQRLETFAFGGIDFNTPEEAILNSQKAMIQANLDTMNDKGLNIMKGIGTGFNLAGQLVGKYGSTVAGGFSKPTSASVNPSSLSQGAQALGSGQMNFSNSFTTPQFSFDKKTIMATGGMVAPFGKQVEVEGNEVGEIPNGQMLDFQGPSHEQGGIPVVLPSGTKIYSDRVSIDGKTMADRKKNRERKISALQKKIDAGDKVSKDTLNRYMLTAGKEEALDMSIQQMLNEVDNKKYAGGTGPLGIQNDPNKYLLDSQNTFYTAPQSDLPIYEIEGDKQADIPTQITLPPSNTSMSSNTSPAKKDLNLAPVQDFLSALPTIGDVAGLYGTLHGAYAGKKNTLQERLGDTANRNAFKQYGQEGLKTLDESKMFAKQIGDIQRSEVELSRRTATDQNRKSARGINTLRALDLASQAGANRLDMQIYQDQANRLQNILGQEASMKNQIDQVVMGGEQAKDIANRQDRAQFYSNLTKDEQTIGKGWEAVGHNVNSILERNASMKAMNAAYGNFKFDSKGNLKGIPGNIEAKANISSFENNKEHLNYTTQDKWDKMSDNDKLKLMNTAWLDSLSPKSKK